VKSKSKRVLFIPLRFYHASKKLTRESQISIKLTSELGVAELSREFSSLPLNHVVHSIVKMSCMVVQSVNYWNLCIYKIPGVL